MRFVSLKPEHINELVELEGKMYWQGEKWKDLWEKEAKEKFRVFIKDYLVNFPEGCFGVIENEQILGAMFLTKVSKLKTIPYLHKFSDYFEKEGKIAYVSFFVVKEEKRNKKETIALELYDYADKVSTNIRCRTIEVVIYSSPIEEVALNGNNYERLEEQFEWEIYPGKKVSSSIYFSNLLINPS